MKKIIFLGYVVRPQEADALSGNCVASNKMQWNIIKNLSMFKDVQIDSISIMPIAAFPNDKILVHRREEIELFPMVKSIRIGFLNVPFIKQFMQSRQVYREAKKILRKNPNAIILYFNLFPQLGFSMRKISKKYPKAKVVCLLADLTLDKKVSSNIISRFIRKRFDALTKKNLIRCSNYIVLNQAMLQGLGDKNYITIDGGVDSQQIIPYHNTEKVERNILYSGALTEYNGVENLLKAMVELKDYNVVLDLYGTGELDELVTTFANKYKNIRYHGKVPNEEVMRNQREAWLLINPRIINSQISKYSFPSKTFEYMLSGTPILTTKLSAYTWEYEDKMIFIENDSESGLVKAITDVLSMDQKELNNFAYKAYRFVCSERTWEKQCKKIHDFLLDL